MIESTHAEQPAARLVFACCTSDPWVLEVGSTLAKVAHKVGAELLVIGAGSGASFDEAGFIDLGNLRIEVTERDVMAMAAVDEKKLRTVVERQHEYVSRRDLRAHPNPAELEAELRRRLAEAVVLLRLLEPDLVMVWNGMMSLRAVYAIAAETLGVPRLFLEKGVYPESFSMDPLGINAASSLATLGRAPVASEQDLRRWTRMVAAIDEAGSSAWPQPQRARQASLRRRLGLPPDRRVVFFPGQVDHDSNIVCFSSHFHDSQEALRWLVHGVDPSRHTVLAKPHPKGRLEVADMRRIVGDLGVVAADVNVLDAIELADCVVSINSSVAFEAAIRGTPVILLGRGILSSQPFAFNYRPGDTAGPAVDQAIDRYAAQRDELFAAAADFGVYLMARYYAFRDDPESAVRLLREHLESLPAPRHKRFARGELMPLVRPITTDEIARRFEGRSLLRIALAKLLRKIRPRRPSGVD